MGDASLSQPQEHQQQPDELIDVNQDGIQESESKDMNNLLAVSIFHVHFYDII